MDTKYLYPFRPMDPYGSLLSHDDGWCQINFFDKNEIFGSKRASGQIFRFFAPSYHNVAYKGLTSFLKSIYVLSLTSTSFILIVLWYVLLYSPTISSNLLIYTFFDTEVMYL